MHRDRPVTLAAEAYPVFVVDVETPVLELSHRWSVCVRDEVGVSSIRPNPEVVSLTAHR